MFRRGLHKHSLLLRKRFENKLDKKILSDERLEININKSGRNAFIVSVPVFAVSTVIVVLLKDISVYTYAFVVNVVLQLSTFSISLRLYEKRGE